MKYYQHASINLIGKNIYSFFFLYFFLYYYYSIKRNIIIILMLFFQLKIHVYYPYSCSLKGFCSIKNGSIYV